jgi:hypothetical protein
MTTCFLAPDPIQSTQFIPGGNTPANGGQLFFYLAGSSTKQTVYKDSTASVAWTNPIVLDSGGNLPSGGEVWFPTGVTFKVVFAPSTDTDPPTSPYWTRDNLPGINDTSASTSEWVSGPAPTFVNATQFTLAGDQTATFHKARRLKTTNTGGTVYSTIVTSVFGVLTTVTVVNDSPGTLDSGLSAVFYGLESANNPSIAPDAVHRKGVAVASAATTDIWSIAGDYVHITGTTTISHFSTSPYAGAERDIIFDSTPTVSSGGNISLPGGAFVAAANDRAKVRADTTSSNVVTFYQRANGTSLIGNALTFLSSASAASSASLDFTGLTGFAAYELHLNSIRPVSDAVALWLRASTSNGAQFTTTLAYGYANVGLLVGTGFVQTTSNTDTKIVIQSDSSSSATANGISGKITFVPTQGHMATWQAIGRNSAGGGGNMFSNAGGGFFVSGVPNALRLEVSSGNIATGTVYCYGVRNA